MFPHPEAKQTATIDIDPIGKAEKIVCVLHHYVRKYPPFGEVWHVMEVDALNDKGESVFDDLTDEEQDKVWDKADTWLEFSDWNR